MSIKEDLLKLKNQLARVEKEREERIPKWKAAYREARSRGASEKDLADMKHRYQDYDRLSSAAIDTVKGKIAALQGKVDSAEKKLRSEARANLEGQKAKALIAWKDNGGDEEGFNAAWPEIEKDMLKQKTIEALKTRQA